MFVEWGEGGRAALMSRVIREYRADKGFANPLTGEELAVLLDHYKSTPIPLEFRAIVQKALRGTRKAKTGPKHSLNPIEQLQEPLLAIRYAEGMANGTKLRHWLKQRQKKQRRNARPYTIPTVRHCACHHVRKWLPKFRGMTDEFPTS